MVYLALRQPRGTMLKPGLLSDPMSLRDALRGLRHAVRRGGESFLDAMPINALPRPAADLAGVALRPVLPGLSLAQATDRRIHRKS